MTFTNTKQEIVFTADICTGTIKKSLINVTSQMPISDVSSHTRTFGSCIKPFAESSYCPGRCSQLSGYLNFAHNGLQHANGTLT